LKRTYVIFILILICHIQGCFIFLFVKDARTWIPPTDFGAIETDVFQEEEGFMFQYFKMFYHSALVYSMVDISVRTTDELVLLSSLIIISAMINAIIYGQFAMLTEELNRDSNDFANKINLVNSVMAQEKVPMNQKKDIRNHILTTHSLKRLQDEFKAFNDNISPSL